MRSFLLSLCFLSLGCPGGLCGDNALDLGEACDDGNTANADGCEADCSLPACENGVIDPGEVCLLLPTELETDEAPSDLITADLNGDSLPDIATANAGGQSLTVFLGDGFGVFTRLPEVELGVFGSRLTVGDFDGDNSQDLAALLKGLDLVRVFRGLGDGSFEKFPSPSPRRIKSASSANTVAAISKKPSLSKSPVVSSAMPTWVGTRRGARNPPAAELRNRFTSPLAKSLAAKSREPSAFQSPATREPIVVVV